MITSDNKRTAYSILFASLDNPNDGRPILEFKFKERK
jgi:hypothetical protein